MPSERATDSECEVKEKQGKRGWRGDRKADSGESWTEYRQEGVNESSVWNVHIELKRRLLHAVLEVQVGALTSWCTWWQRGWGAASAGSPQSHGRAPSPGAAWWVCCKTCSAQTPGSPWKWHTEHLVWWHLIYCAQYSWTPLLIFEQYFGSFARKTNQNRNILNISGYSLTNTNLFLFWVQCF